MTQEVAAELCRRWQEHHDEAAANRLLKAFRPLAVSVATRGDKRLPAWFDIDDVIGACLEGILNAATHYRPDLGMSFKSYAFDRAKWSKFRQSDRARRSWRLGWPVDIDAPLNGEDGHTLAEILPGPSVDVTVADTITEALDRLDPRDRDIVSLYYLSEWPVEAIAQRHNLSVSRVHQIILNAIRRLRRRLRWKTRHDIRYLERQAQPRVSA